MNVFSQALTEKIEAYLTRYETRRSAILPVLHAIQDEHGWIHEEHVETLHNHFGLDRVHVKEVITFYDIYKDQPVKKHIIRFCKSFTCHMLGAPEAMHRIEQHIEQLTAEMGDDCPFQLEPFPCLGKCDGAPVMLVGKDRHEHVTADRVDSCLSQYAKLPK
jgi:NADH-quinone oxidoreductase subunit E